MTSNHTNLDNLPFPPTGKAGWPWTEESAPVPSVMPDGKEWPKISIVTPSYNQGRFLEETIRSVLLQNYPNLEYIIMDGGSTDNSVEIIKKYEPWISYWTSEKDGGQVAAINRGFQQSTGTIFNWLNSDDIYLKNALRRVAEVFVADSTIQLLFGEHFNITEQGEIKNRDTIGANRVTLFHVLYMGRWPFHQESVFFRKDLWSKVGGLQYTYQLGFDFDFFLRCLRHTDAATLPGEALGCWRHHPAQKLRPANKNLLNEEHIAIYRRYRSRWMMQWMIRVLWSIGRRTVWRHDRTLVEVSKTGMRKSGNI